MDALPIIVAPLIPRVGGARSHPDLAYFKPGDAQQWQAWLQEQRLEVMQVWMEDDAEAADIYRKFLLGDAVGALSAWQPCEPNGEKAWFLLAVFDGGKGRVLILCIGLQVALSREISETAIAKLLDT